MNHVLKKGESILFKEISLTTGSLKKVLLIFALPLFLSQLFQTFYNTADTVIVGYCLGDLSLAAIGAVTALFELVVGFCTGFGQGLAVIAAQKFGAKDMDGYRKVVGQSILLSLAAAIILSVLMMIFLKDILIFMKTSEDILDLSYSYISVICMGLWITVSYNLCAGMLRAAGDSTAPLVILLISSILNIFLDLLFIISFHMGVTGTAWATLLAQLISLIICVIWMLVRKKELMPSLSDFKLDLSLDQELTMMGLSMAFMSSIVSAGSLILQIVINVQGTMIVSGHTAARKISSILMLPPASLMMALSSFVAQNIGAKEYERAEKGIAFSNRLAIYYSLAMTAIVYLLSNWIVATISGSSNSEVLDTGSLYLRTNIPFYPFLGVLLNLRMSLQSMSIKAVPIFSSVIELAGKVLFTLFIVPVTGYLGVSFTEPVIWIVMCLFLAFFYLRNPVFKEHGIRCRIFS